jgi:CRISPR/Cas system-associated protein Cas10 (large subunit of type III CRISPR-Cas system)
MLSKEGIAISQLTNYQYWKDSISYGKRWIVESVSSVLKRVFGEYVMAHKRHNRVKELELKASLYNRFISTSRNCNWNN